MSHHTQSEWTAILQKMELLWYHDGNPKRPHALLTSGGHSSGFFNAGKFLFDHPRLARQLAEDLKDLLETLQEHACTDSRKPTKTLGPAFGAITWASNLADAFNIGCAFTVPYGEGVNKQFQLEKRFRIVGDLVLPVEDVITTGDSIQKTLDVASSNGAEISSVIAAICNRSGLNEIGGRPIVAMITIPMKNWKEEDCPFCKAGSKAIRPKDAGNWSLLSKPYPQTKN